MATVFKPFPETGAFIELLLAITRGLGKSPGRGNGMNSASFLNDELIA
jgi:hypothetical protein